MSETYIAEPSDVDYDPFAGPALVATSASTEPQREIWTATNMGEEASLAFNESFSLFLEGRFSSDAFRAAVRDLVHRHDSLRATFSGDGLTLCIAEPFEPELPIHDWRDLGREDQELRWRERLEVHVRTPFDLMRGPLFRVECARLSDTSHRMVFTAHHIVCDGWSTAVLCRDLAALYNRHCGVESTLNAADSFIAFAVEQGQTPSETTALHEGYWLNQFRGEIPVLDLPCDRPRPALKTYTATREDVVLPRELVTGVRRAGAQHKASLFATMLAAFSALVHRLTSQEDFVIGMPAAGQSVRGHDDLVGHCVNTLPFRIATHLEQPFTELLAAVRTLMLDAYEHQEYTFGSLLRKLPLTRDPSRPPLIAVAFNVERGMTSENMGFHELEAKYSVNPRRYENFEIFLNCVETEGEIELQCQYNTDLFETDTIRRWLSAYRELLQGVAREPSEKVGRLRLMSPQEEHRLVHELNAAADESVEASCIHASFGANVARSPEAIALRNSAGSMTYRDLDLRSNRLARRLIACGVGANDLVALCMERSPEQIVALLGILKAGGGYLPIEPNYPLARMQFMLDDARPKATIVHEALKSKLPPAGGETLVWEEVLPGIEALDDSPLGSRATPEDIAYVIYTSGSTGKPKGVEVPHRAVDRLVKNARFARLDQQTVMLQAAPVAFDASTFEIWGALCNGGTLALHHEQVPSAAGLGQSIREYGVTTMWLTAALFNAVVDEDVTQLAALEELLTGGEVLSVPHVQRALKNLPNTQLINGYGPTETTTFATCYRIPKVLAPDVSAIPIGSAIRQTRLYVLDANRSPVIQGAIGELYIGGKGVARRYLARPELTAERFIADPYHPGELAYRTGDLVRWRSDGVLEFFGRADQQVKIRGFRIELGEIEETFLRHEAVQKAAVTMRQDRPGDKRLVGYFVLQPGAAATPDELRDYAKAVLPEYMLPSNYVFLDAMPLTASGKVDRKALPAPKAGASDEDFVAPRSPTEQLLADLWREALRVDRISVHDDFFALGGHSLLASQILARLRRDHGINLSFRKVFEAPTVARFALLIEGAPTDSVKERGEAVIPRRGPEAKVPLTIIQHRHWMLEELQPSQRLVHSVRGTWQFEGELKVELLQRALDEIARRHEILRLSVSVQEGTPQLQFAPSVELTIQQIDLRSLPTHERDEAMIAQTRVLHQQTFDLGKVPLFRSYLFRVGDTTYSYFTLRHSMIWDGWSYDIFLKELCGLYESYETGTSVAVPELPIGFGDFAVWHSEFLRSAELERQVAWWRSHHSGAPADVKMPLDFPRPPRMTHVGGNERATLTKEDADALTALARTAGATLFTALFACYVALIHRYTSQKEMVVGVPVRGRNRAEIENLIGNFVNTLAIRATVESSQTFAEFLASMRDLTLDAFSNQDMPLEMLGDDAPIINVLFSFQDARERPRKAGSLTVTQLYRPLPVAGNDLMLWVMDYGDHLLAVLNYSSEVLSRDTASRFLSRYVGIVRQAIQNPNQRITDFELHDEADVARLKGYGSPIFAERPVQEWAFTGLDRVAVDFPSGTAVSDATSSMTLDELRMESNRVAHALRSRGVTLGSTVAVALAPSCALAAAVYGVWKAGARLVLLDPSHPSEYNRRILDSARAQCLLTLAEFDELVQSSNVSLLLDRDRGEIAQTDGRTPVDLAGSPADSSAIGIAVLTGGGGVDWSDVSHAVLAGMCSVTRDGAASGKALGCLAGSPAGRFFYLCWTLCTSNGSAVRLWHDRSGAAEELTGVTSGESRPMLIADAELWAEVLAQDTRTHSALDGFVIGRLPHDAVRALIPRLGTVWAVFWSPLGRGATLVRRLESEADRYRIGKPTGASRAAVLDGTGRMAPVGIYGALYLGTAYDGRSEGVSGHDASGQSSLQSSLTGTGLVARWNHDFELELDHEQQGKELLDVVTLDGIVVSLRALADELKGHSAVGNCAIVRYERGLADQRLVAFVESRVGQDFTESELRRHMRRRVPAAIVPRLFVELQRMPLDRSGSVDLQALPSPFERDTGVENVAPRTDSERLVAKLWQEALRLPAVSVYGNFFDLGGHSLLCFKVLAQIEQATGKKLNPRLLLLNSLEQVAAVLEGDSAPDPVESPQGPPVKESGLGGRVLGKLGKLLGR